MFVEAHFDVEVLLDKRKWRNRKRGMVSFCCLLMKIVNIKYREQYSKK